MIVGSGPAGSAAAIGALSCRPSASVLLVDRVDFPRDKACGDAVLDAALAELESYGVARHRIVGDHRSVDTLRITSPRGVQVSGQTRCPITIVPRMVLDANLRTAARTAGAESVRHTVRSVRELDTCVEIDGKLKARVLIAADGAESAVRRSLIGSRRRDIAVAIRGYARTTGDPVPTIMLDDRPGLAYAWRFPTAGGPTNVGYGRSLASGETVSRSVLLRKMHVLLPGLEVDPTTIRAHRLPLSTSAQPLARGRVLFAGDAASLINPVSGEGINYAIATGLAAGAASMLGAARAGQHYRASVQRRLGRHHHDIATLAAITQSRTLLEAGARAARTNPRVFEDIATLGIGEGLLTPRLIVGMATEVLLGAARSLLPAGLVRERG
ncbi:MAG TPA: FAD-dependent monooxygenase [Jatrophihabitans sp.]|nr:FAD-dependent monooxygenase [Jatrophihabitans sp.]